MLEVAHEAVLTIWPARHRHPPSPWQGVGHDKGRRRRVRAGVPRREHPPRPTAPRPAGLGALRAARARPRRGRVADSPSDEAGAILTTLLAQQRTTLVGHIASVRGGGVQPVRHPARLRQPPAASTDDTVRLWDPAVPSEAFAELCQRFGPPSPDDWTLRTRGAATRRVHVGIHRLCEATSPSKYIRSLKGVRVGLPSTEPA